MDRINDGNVSSPQGKYFPRARALFDSADTADWDRWSFEMLRYLQAVTWRIESVKGRLSVAAFHKSQWDMKSAQLKMAIENGPHLRYFRLKIAAGILINF